MCALGGMLVVKPMNLSGNVKTLAKKGLIRRELNTINQRSLLAVLTPEGDAFLKVHLPAYWKRLERLIGGLTRLQRLQLITLLRQLTDPIARKQDQLIQAEAATMPMKTFTKLGGTAPEVIA
jgi:DNA-binding MarR family transcriptional regulator